MSLVLYLISLVAAAIGYVLAAWLVDTVDLSLGGLSDVEVIALINALAWFLVCFVVYFAATKLKDVKWFKLVSAKFFLTWIFVCIGVIFGLILWSLIDTGSVNVTTDQMRFAFFFYLPITLGPTGAASLGLRD